MSRSRDVVAPAQNGIDLHWDVKIPLRDGTRLSASLYLPKGNVRAVPCLVALTPYTVQRNHLRASFFAAHGYPFLSVDVRGRGNSEGMFNPLVQEAQDGYDVVEWLAKQAVCNGKVGMFSGSYEGYVQWAAAKEFPPHLAAIAPGMTPVPGLDWPMRSGIMNCNIIRWLTYVSGRAAQENIVGDESFWRRKFREWYESGRAFNELDAIVGNPSPIFQEWLAHPTQDSYWDDRTLSSHHFAGIDLPILTLTGCYDGIQGGAVHLYREHVRHATRAAAAKHYLVIGPWEHSQVFSPKPEAAGVKLGPAAALDVLMLNLQWYDWTLRGERKPEFLQKNVAYYVMGAEEWRYAETLEAATERSIPLFLHSTVNPTDMFKSGSLSTEGPAKGGPDHYVYDPGDLSLAALEYSTDPDSRVDQRMVHAAIGKRLIYHSAPFDEDTEVTGFFKLALWLSIDQPDTDFRASVYEVGVDGSAIELTSDWMRARYRKSLREEELVRSTEPLCYDFNRFLFISRRIRKGHRLRLVVGPLSSIYSQRNHNSGGSVSNERVRDGSVVTVRLFHDEFHPSVLHVPIGCSGAELQMGYGGRTT
jgi:putative CocE/NonD family hydrolase